MSIESMALALKVPGLTPAEKLVLIGIANHDGDGGAWPSVATLAVYLGASGRSVQYAIANLVKKGFLTVERNAGGSDRTPNDRRPNLYRLHLDGVKEIAPRNHNGVKPSAQRGEAGFADGVKLVAPETSLEPSIEPSANVNDEFSKFWTAYPRKIGKPSASKAWKKVKGEEYLAVMLGLSVRVKFWKDSKTEVQFIPHPATWLNDRRWEDEVPELPGRGGDGGPGPGYHWSERRQIWIADGMG